MSSIPSSPSSSEPKAPESPKDDSEDSVSDDDSYEGPSLEAITLKVMELLGPDGFEELQSMKPAEAADVLEYTVQYAVAVLRGEDLEPLKEQVRKEKECEELVNTANEHLIQYEQTGNLRALKEALQLYRTAYDITPVSDFYRSAAVTNLGLALGKSFGQTGDPEVLTECITVHREALELAPSGDPRASCLNNLSTALKQQYEETGDIAILEEAITLLQEALDLRPPGHSDRASSLDNLAGSLMMQPTYEHDVVAQELTIRMLRETYAILQSDNASQDQVKNNLGIALHSRFRRDGNVADLVEAIQLHREALLLRPLGHFERDSSIRNLAVALKSHYQQNQDPSLLEDIIQLSKEATECYPKGHPSLPGALVLLADALEDKYELTKDIHILDQAVEVYQEALNLKPLTHISRPYHLQFVGDALFRRFQHLGHEEDLVRALNLYKEGVAESFDGHESSQTLRHKVARLLLKKTPLFDWDQALEILISAAEDETVSAGIRLEMALNTQNVVNAASYRNADYLLRSRLLLDWNTSVIRLLPLAAHQGLNLTTRLHILEGADGLAGASAFRAVCQNEPTMAVELFEQGKTVFWQQALQLRSKALESLPHDDALQLERLFRAMETIVHTPRDVQAEERTIVKENELRRQMGGEITSLLRQIRSRPGLERFLQIPGYEQLSQAALRGPVVVLGMHGELTYAIMIGVRGKHYRTHTFMFENMFTEELKTLVTRVSGAGMRDRQRGSLDMSDNTNVTTYEVEDLERGMSIEKKRPREPVPLAELWLRIVEPVIQRLELPRASGRDRPRIHWCPSGAFAMLPLHAAGIYDSANPVCTADYAVSSYIPSLSSLIKARENYVSITRDQLQTLLVAQPKPPDMEPLVSVEEEVQTIAGLMVSSSATVLNDVYEVASVDSVLKTLPQAHVLHLACHGQQSADPLSSSFAFCDGPLPISALMKLDLPNATLAFLSACETAKGHAKLPDQAVHLAASLLFCGFRSVIATMWTMHDFDGPQIAQWVYESLLEKEEIDLDDIPYALDDAVRRLRQSGASASRWATFIHLGA